MSICIWWCREATSSVERGTPRWTSRKVGRASRGSTPSASRAGASPGSPSTPSGSLETSQPSTTPRRRPSYRNQHSWYPPHNHKQRHDPDSSTNNNNKKLGKARACMDLKWDACFTASDIHPHSQQLQLQQQTGVSLSLTR